MNKLNEGLMATVILAQSKLTEGQRLLTELESLLDSGRLYAREPASDEASGDFTARGLAVFSTLQTLMGQVGGLFYANCSKEQVRKFCGECRKELEALAEQLVPA